MRRVAAILGALALAATALTFGGTTAMGATAAVEIFDNAFSPSALSIAPGTTVTFTNHGSRAHTVTASSPASAFDSGYIMPGGSWSYTFATTGTYVYHCEIHTGMAGTITVSDGTPLPSGTAISITDNAFTPPSLSVGVGATVTWRNDGTVTHTVTNSVFGAQRLAPGQSFTYTFATAGTYPYVCDIHPGMAGTVTVGAPSVTPPPTTPPPSATATPAAAASVMIMNDQFTPATLTVDPGATVTWTNHDAVTHTVTRGGLFDMMVRPGQSVTFTFTTAGTYDYICAVHAGMSGSIVVRGTPGASPSPTPVATPTATPALTGTVVNIGDNVFSPASVSIAAGGTVTWHNSGTRYHTVTGSGLAATIAPGGTYQYTFPTTGAYSYQCDFHPEMSGVILVGGAAPPPPTPPPPPVPVPSLAPGSFRVDVNDNAFSPASVTVTAGSTVTWVDRGRAMHSVTASDGSFDATLRSGQTYSFTFTKPGTYAYLCTFHDGMTGTVVVTGAAASPSPTAGIRPTPSATPTQTATPSPAAVPPKALTVVIADNDFTPGTTRVPAGTTVAWVNHGRIRHTVTSATSIFDSGLMSPEGVFTVTFDVPGTYPYLCDIHPQMRGTIEVYDAEGAAPPAATAPPATPVPSPSRSATAATDVRIVDNAFEPRALTVPAGTTVRWTNLGKAKHTVTFTGASITSPLLAAGDAFEATLATPGTYAYLCALHPEMTAEIVVTGGGAAVTTPAPKASSGAVVTATPGIARAATAPPSVPAGAGSGWAWILGVGLGLIGAFGIGLPLIAAHVTSPEERAAELRRRRGW